MEMTIVSWVWCICLFVIEVPKLGLIVFMTQYRALGGLPSQPAMSSTKWWLGLHIVFVLYYVYQFAQFLHSWLNSLTIRKDLVQTISLINFIITIGVLFNLSNSTNLSPLVAFLFNFVSVFAFFMTWSKIQEYIFTPNSNVKKYIIIHWCLLTIPFVAQMIGFIIEFKIILNHFE